MEAAPLRPANRTSFGQQLKAAREQQLKELRNAQQNKRRRSWEVEVNPKPVQAKPDNSAAALKARQEKADLLQKYRDEEKAKKERIKKEKQLDRERELAKRKNKKIALLDNANMNKGYSAPNSHRGRDKVFKTIPFSKEGLIEVKVDKNTTIYVKPGTDIEAAKQKILNRHDQYKNQQKARLEGKNAAMRDFE